MCALLLTKYCGFIPEDKTLDVILTYIPDSDNLEIEMYKQMIWKSIHYLTSERRWDCFALPGRPCSVCTGLARRCFSVSPHVLLNK